LGADEGGVVNKWVVTGHVRSDIQPLVPGPCEIRLSAIGSTTT
jgi:hypothetical protein